MKFILSRKGFDSRFGGHPSPVLPDGTMLSLPIPAMNSKGDKTERGIPAGKLNLRGFEDAEASYHFDPDIRPEMHRELPKGWRPLFGQSRSPQGHLSKQEVNKGDVFLFFGLFQKTDDDRRFIGKPFHAIWGYLEICGIATEKEEIRQYSWHPHSFDYYNAYDNNTLYLSDPGKSGGFRFTEELILTKSGSPVSHWDDRKLPWLDRVGGNPNMSYHTEKSFKDGYFQSAYPGQEFVIAESATGIVRPWFRKILEFRAEPS